MKDILLTQEGIAKLKKELKQLIDVDRKEIIKKIKETREYGDLSENAEYDAARNQQSMIEGRIEELEALLKKAKVIDEKKATASHDKVVIGSKVQVEVEGDKEDYILVGSAESDPTTGHISIESPLGQALVGAKIGQVVEVAIPDGGKVAYKILKIN
jgi:transcription elongation factor GreA